MSTSPKNKYKYQDKEEKLIIEKIKKHIEIYRNDPKPIFDELQELHFPNRSANAIRKKFERLATDDKRLKALGYKEEDVQLLRSLVKKSTPTDGDGDSDAEEVEGLVIMNEEGSKIIRKFFYQNKCLKQELEVVRGRCAEAERVREAAEERCKQAMVQRNESRKRRQEAEEKRVEEVVEQARRASKYKKKAEELEEQVKLLIVEKEKAKEEERKLKRVIEEKKEEERKWQRERDRKKKEEEKLKKEMDELKEELEKKKKS
ncbi:capping protein inhibiting regulator of actin dynamics-like [Frankliniella occidentalis]|uniref:Capping protein inhibiting regulator of actin dynamics-like n=1 Tax=Frankliniella occidentalis TaxID=133901 RepID=A0A9C6U886_FRAOC|nr:capping protein inhibiting regulator of actin dynamics-like [Frankliniella occidentalis]